MDRQHRAMLTWDGSAYLLDTARVADIAARPLPHSLTLVVGDAQPARVAVKRF